MCRYVADMSGPVGNAGDCAAELAAVGALSFGLPAINIEIPPQRPVSPAAGIVTDADEILDSGRYVAARGRPLMAGVQPMRQWLTFPTRGDVGQVHVSHAADTCTCPTSSRSRTLAAHGGGR
jgi:hypothetical protein